jgi:hypothetical protein
MTGKPAAFSGALEGGGCDVMKQKPPARTFELAVPASSHQNRSSRKSVLS